MYICEKNENWLALYRDLTEWCVENLRESDLTEHLAWELENLTGPDWARSTVSGWEFELGDGCASVNFRSWHTKSRLPAEWRATLDDFQANR